MLNYMQSRTLLIILVQLVLVLTFEVQGSHHLRIRRQSDSPCTRYQWQCTNGECISSDEQCDGEANCQDESDETPFACSSVHCPSYSYRCAYGACVDGKAECNGEKECHDNSDELSLKCPGILNSLGARGNCTNADDIQCNVSGECISEDLMCDGAVDCKDGSDETSDKCSSAYCPSYGFRCDYGGCINAKSKCDGEHDCADGSDENETLCGRTTTIRAITTSSTDRNILPMAEGGCLLQNLPDNLLLCYESMPTVGLAEGETVEQFASIKYKCNSKFTLVGNTTNFCLDGSWIVPHPVCKKYCSAVPISGVTIKTTCEFDGIPIICDNNLNPGTVARITCQFGYKKPEDVVQDILVCEESGNWDYYPFRCEQICGTEAAEGISYVVGGTTANITKVPWHVALYNDIKVKGSYTHMCGGTILSAKIVISAAHCFWDQTENAFYPESHFYVGVGKYYRDYNATEPLKAQFLRVAKIHHKPEYNDIDGLYFSDIAILILTDFIVFKSYVKPICLNTDLEYNEQTVPSGWVGRVAGWGLTASGGEASSVLKVVDLAAVDYHECKNSSTPQFRPFITGDKFCAGYLNSNINVCEGDSGGGLVFPKESKHRKTYFLRGIVSTGANKQGSCDTDKYTTFTNIQFYLKMILSHMTENRPK